MSTHAFPPSTHSHLSHKNRWASSSSKIASLSLAQSGAPSPSSSPLRWARVAARAGHVRNALLSVSSPASVCVGGGGGVRQQTGAAAARRQRGLTCGRQQKGYINRGRPCAQHTAVSLLASIWRGQGDEACENARGCGSERTVWDTPSVTSPGCWQTCHASRTCVH
jgi:hypothetical protein